MRSSATNVDDYMAALPPERRAALEAVRAVIQKHLDPAFEEGMQYGMIGYYVPHRIFPAGYHTDPQEPLPFLALASQKQNMALYLMHLNADGTEDKWFRSAWAKSGKKLDMGKSCLRFRKLDELALDVLSLALQRVSVKAYIEQYQRQRQAHSAGPAKAPARAAQSVGKPRALAKKVASKKPPEQKLASKKLSPEKKKKKVR